METYKIKTTGFEGPMELLLGLVEKRKILINDLSLAQVTDDYVSYIKSINETRPNEISNFIIVAATLILIKSKSLLPNLDLSLEEEKDIHDLEERLRLYQIFSKLSKNIKNIFGQKIIFTPLESSKKNVENIFVPDEQITLQNLYNFAQNVLNNIPKKEVLSEVIVKKVISLEEMIENLTGRIQDSLKTNFLDFTRSKISQEDGLKEREKKIIVVVGFLAILELVRQGIMDAIQESHADDIILEKQS
jgi:segregation and condensation protein A